MPARAVFDGRAAGRPSRPQARQAVATIAWYRTQYPTFADTLAAVRRQFWQEQGLFTSHSTAEEQKCQPVLHKAIAYAICYAA